MFDTLATYPVMEGSKCAGVVVENVNGREYFEAGAVVDATGNASVMDRAGVPTVPGQNFMSIPHMPQFRTIRRIEGKVDFNAINGETYEDAIGWCGDFRPHGIGKHYQVPFGALFHEDFENLVAAGRIISAPQGDGWEVSRVIPVCALTGEAAGKAAALCALKRISMEQIREHYLEEIICM